MSVCTRRLCLAGVFNDSAVSAAQWGCVTHHLGCFFLSFCVFLLSGGAAVPPCILRMAWTNLDATNETSRGDLLPVQSGEKVDPCSGPAAPSPPALALTAGTPFVSSFCTPNPTRRRSRPPPLVPKMPLGPGQICSLCVLENRTSVKCTHAPACVCVCVLAVVAVGDVRVCCLG